MNGENDTMYYIHKDYLGSYDVITDERGNVLERLSFDPWGRRRNPYDWTLERTPVNHIFDRGYTGHEHLDVFSLINMNGRVYDPWLGRFLSPDPFIQSPGYSQSFNRYSYCFNNPLKYSDPSGFNAWKLNENPFQTFGSGNPGVFRIDWNANLSEPGSYSYDWWTGNYYNANGQEVSFDEVFVNYIQPNSTCTYNCYSSSSSNNIKQGETLRNQQSPNKNVYLLAGIKEALLNQGDMMFNGTLEQVLEQEEDPIQDNRVNLITSLNVISELFDRIQTLNREGDLINLYDIIRPNGYGELSPLGRFYKKTIIIGSYEYQVFVYAYSEHQKNSFYDIEEMGFGYLDRCGNYTPDKRFNGGYYIGFYMINSGCCNLITIGARNPDAYHYLNSYFHSFDN